MLAGDNAILLCPEVEACFDAAKTERGKLQWNARSRMECCEGCHAEVLHTFQYSSV